MHGYRDHIITHNEIARGDRERLDCGVADARIRPVAEARSACIHADSRRAPTVQVNVRAVIAHDFRSERNARERAVIRKVRAEIVSLERTPRCIAGKQRGLRKTVGIIQRRSLNIQDLLRRK